MISMRKKAVFHGPPYIWEHADVMIPVRPSPAARVVRFWLAVWFLATLGVGFLLLTNNALIWEFSARALDFVKVDFLHSTL
jgi:hypothetical protein